MSSEFNLSDVRIEGLQKGVASKSLPPVRGKGLMWFIKGPIPFEWISLASRLPGKALHVGLFLWYWIGLKKEMSFKFSTSRLKVWGITKSAALRALDVLERANLIKIGRSRGRSGVVTILADVKRMGRKN